MNRYIYLYPQFTHTVVGTDSTSFAYWFVKNGRRENLKYQMIELKNIC